MCIARLLRRRGTTRLRMHFLGRVGFDDSMTAADAVYLSDDLAMRRAFDCVCGPLRHSWHSPIHATERRTSVVFFLEVIPTDEIQFCDLFDRLAPGSPINFKTAMPLLIPFGGPHAQFAHGDLLFLSSAILQLILLSSSSSCPPC